MAIFTKRRWTAWLKLTASWFCRDPFNFSMWRLTCLIGEWYHFFRVAIKIGFPGSGLFLIQPQHPLLVYQTELETGQRCQQVQKISCMRRNKFGFWPTTICALSLSTIYWNLPGHDITQPLLLIFTKWLKSHVQTWGRGRKSWKREMWEEGGFRMGAANTLSWGRGNACLVS